MENAQRRITQLSSQLNTTASSSSFSFGGSMLHQSPNDVVITLATRSALTSSRNGAFKDTSLEHLLVEILKAVRERSNLAPELVEEIAVGNVLCKDAGFLARGAALAAGFPYTTCTSIVSRWCSSGLLATQSIVNQILSGSIDVGIALGAESMSSHPDKGAPPFGPELSSHPVANDVTMPMGWTSENLAAQYSISREVQDEYAAQSFQKAERSQNAGWPNDEIHQITTQWVDPKNGDRKLIVVDRDDGVRFGTTKEALAKIRAAFPQWPPSTTTGGNASQISDGVAALLLMRRSKALALGQPIIAKFAASVSSGVEPRIMGAGPTVAIPKLLQKTGLTKQEIDVWEINEAFASVIAFCVQELDIDPEKVNPRGGAIAFGHPLGCTGVRQIVTAISELKRIQKKTAITSMCVGSGMGMAALIVCE